MAKYKLRGDYSFYTDKDPLRNKVDGEGKVIGDPIIIDDKVRSVEGQLHKLELIPEKKPEVKVDKKPATKPEPKAGSAEQGNTVVESALPVSSALPEPEKK